MVRSLLQYLTHFWYTHVKKDVEKWSSVERRSKRMSKGMKNRPASEKLLKLQGATCLLQCSK